MKVAARKLFRKTMLPAYENGGIVSGMDMGGMPPPPPMDMGGMPPPPPMGMDMGGMPPPPPMDPASGELQAAAGMIENFKNIDQQLDMVGDNPAGVIQVLTGKTVPEARNDLAGIVGLPDAQQTPDSVLALVQPTLLIAEQASMAEQGGIQTLGMGEPPPMGMGEPPPFPPAALGDPSNPIAAPTIEVPAARFGGYVRGYKNAGYVTKNNTPIGNNLIFNLTNNPMLYGPNALQPPIGGETSLNLASLSRPPEQVNPLSVGTAKLGTAKPETLTIKKAVQDIDLIKPNQFTPDYKKAKEASQGFRDIIEPFFPKVVSAEENIQRTLDVMDRVSPKDERTAEERIQQKMETLEPYMEKDKTYEQIKQEYTEDLMSENETARDLALINYFTKMGQVVSSSTKNLVGALVQGNAEALPEISKFIGNEVKLKREIKVQSRAAKTALDGRIRANIFAIANNTFDNVEKNNKEQDAIVRDLAGQVAQDEMRQDRDRENAIGAILRGNLTAEVALEKGYFDNVEQFNATKNAVILAISQKTPDYYMDPKNPGKVVTGHKVGTNILTTKMGEDGKTTFAQVPPNYQNVSAEVARKYMDVVPEENREYINNIVVWDEFGNLRPTQGYRAKLGVSGLQSGAYYETRIGPNGDKQDILLPSDSFMVGKPGDFMKSEIINGYLVTTIKGEDGSTFRLLGQDPSGKQIPLDTALPVSQQELNSGLIIEVKSQKQVQQYGSFAPRLTKEQNVQNQKRLNNTTTAMQTLKELYQMAGQNGQLTTGWQAGLKAFGTGAANFIPDGNFSEFVTSLDTERGRTLLKQFTQQYVEAMRISDRYNKKEIDKLEDIVGSPEFFENPLAQKVRFEEIMRELKNTQLKARSEIFGEALYRVIPTPSGTKKEPYDIGTAEYYKYAYVHGINNRERAVRKRFSGKWFWAPLSIHSKEERKNKQNPYGLPPDLAGYKIQTFKGERGVLFQWEE